MKVLIDADVIAKSEGGVRLRLHTGFGNPEVLIDAARIELRDDAPLICRAPGREEGPMSDKLKPCEWVSTINGEKCQEHGGNPAICVAALARTEGK